MHVESPTSLDSALAVLRDAASPPHVLAGGTDLMVEMQTGRTHPHAVLDIWRVDELRGIAVDEDTHELRLGALTTCNQLCHAAGVPDILAAAAHEVGAEQIRNRATIGGNLGTASPAADLTPVLFALSARVRLVSWRGSRELPITEFVTGYRSTARQADELIHSIVIPPRAPNEHRMFRKVGTRRAQAISKLVVAVALTVDAGLVRACHAAAGCVADRTVSLPTFARALLGRAPTAANFAAAANDSATTDCAPIDDVRSTARYRREVLRRVLETAFAPIE